MSGLRRTRSVIDSSSDEFSSDIEDREEHSWEDVGSKQQLEALDRSFGDYQMGEIIGKGGQGCVYKGLNFKNGQFVAIKEIAITTDTETSEEEVSKVLKEIELLKDLNHPNIVKLIDFYYEEKKSLRIVLEYIENGSLKDILEKFGYFPEGLAAKYSFQVLQGLSYLHEKNVLHRDIKGANILITKDGICKLADFGVAMKIEPDVPVTAVGSPYWMAPEIFELQDTTKASDVWSFGCTLLELLTGSPPYRELKPTQAMFKILENDQPPFPPNISAELENFLDIIFQKDPLKRPTFKDLLNHPWITLYNPLNFSKGVLKSLQTLLNLPETEDLLSEIKKTALQKPQTFLSKIQEKNQSKTISDLLQHDAATLRELITSFQLENDLLATVAHTVHQDVLSADEHNKVLISNIELIEDNFVTSDSELAHLIYGGTLAASNFQSNRGVLMTCRLKGKVQTKFKWAKRWVALQDNFLFFYKDSEDSQEPIDVLQLRGALIDVNATTGRKFSFQLTCKNAAYFLSAASAPILMKWLNLIQNTTDWYSSGETKISSIEGKKATRAAFSPRRTASFDAKSRRQIATNNNIKYIKLDQIAPSPFPGVRHHDVSPLSKEKLSPRGGEKMLSPRDKSPRSEKSPREKSPRSDIISSSNPSLECKAGITFSAPVIHDGERRSSSSDIIHRPKIGKKFDTVHPIRRNPIIDKRLSAGRVKFNED